MDSEDKKKKAGCDVQEGGRTEHNLPSGNYSRRSLLWESTGNLSGGVYVQGN